MKKTNVIGAIVNVAQGKFLNVCQVKALSEYYLKDKNPSVKTV